MSQIKKKIEQIRDILDEIESLEEVEEQVENSFDVKAFIKQIVENNNKEEILLVLKKSGLKFSSITRLKDLDNDDLVDWIPGLIGDDVSEDNEVIELLREELGSDENERK